MIRWTLIFLIIAFVAALIGIIATNLIAPDLGKNLLFMAMIILVIILFIFYSRHSST